MQECNLKDSYNRKARGYSTLYGSLLYFYTMWGKKQTKKRNAGRMPVFLLWGSAPFSPCKDYGIFKEYWHYDDHRTILATLIREWRLHIYRQGNKTTLF